MIGFLFCASVLASTVTLTNPYSGNFPVEIQGEGERAVIFVHDHAQDQRNFGFLARKMASQKLQTATFDLSGHGERADQEKDFPFMHLDVRTIAQHLQSKGVTDLQCVGEGFGGIVCLQAIGPNVSFSQIAIISPVTSQHHQSLFAHIPEYSSPRPLMVIVSVGDEHGVRCAERLERTTEVIVHEVSGNLRGSPILLEHPQMEQELMFWILRAPILKKRIGIKDSFLFERRLKSR